MKGIVGHVGREGLVPLYKEWVIWSWSAVLGDGYRKGFVEEEALKPGLEVWMNRWEVHFRQKESPE